MRPATSAPVVAVEEDFSRIIELGKTLAAIEYNRRQSTGSPPTAASTHADYVYFRIVTAGLYLATRPTPRN